MKAASGTVIGLLCAMIIVACPLTLLQAATSSEVDAAQWQVITSDQAGITANLHIDRWTIEEPGSPMLLSIPGIAEDTLLPVITTWIALPEGKTVEVDIQTNHGLQPTGVYYNRDSELDGYHEIHAEVQEPARYRGFRIAPVQISPFSFGDNNEVLIANDIQVNARFVDDPVPTSNDPGETRVTAYTRRFLESILLNCDELDLVEVAPMGRILIVAQSDESVRQAIRPYVEWKTMQGYEVVVDEPNDRTSSNSVRNLIQQYYTDNNPVPLEYVLIIGDTDGPISVAAYNYLTDHWYTMVDGNDILGDLAIGRFSVRNLTSLVLVVGKTVAYERDVYMEDTEWLEHACLTAGSGSGISTILTNRAVRWMFVERDIITDTLWYTMNGNIPSFIVNQVNQGAHFVNYRGFYGMDGWGNGHNEGLTNSTRMPIFITLTCGTGSFASQETATSEGIFRTGIGANGYHGAVACIGTATTQTHTRFNNLVDAGIFEGLLMRDLRSLGWSLVHGKTKLYQAYVGTSDSWGIESFSYWNNLMGDPALRAWVGVPDFPEVTHTELLTDGMNAVDVHVETANGLPDLVWATLSSELEVIASSRFDAGGNVRLYSPSFDEYDEITLTVTGDNIVPYITTLSHTDEEYPLIVEAATYNDGDEGDGAANPNEVQEITLTFRNLGDSATNSTTVQVSCPDNRLVIQGQTSFTIPAIAPGATYQYDETVDVLVQPWVNNGELPSITVTIDEQDGYSYALPVSIESWSLESAAELTAINNNLLMPDGEAAQFAIELSNNGILDAENVSVEIIAEFPGITIETGTSSISLVEVGESTATTTPFEIQADSTVPIGAKIPFALYIEDSTGKLDTLRTILYAADPRTWNVTGPDDYGYWAVDNTDNHTMSNYVPFYTWIDIVNSGERLPIVDQFDQHDHNAVIDLPFEFQYYGVVYDRITVSSNGWISFGSHGGQVTFRNWSIPNPLGPPAMIAPFWDDLRTSGGGIYSYFDEHDGRFIIQWDCKAARDGVTDEQFQAILYDPAVWPTYTGNGRILFQYQDVQILDNVNTDNDYATIGIESPDQLSGVEYGYWNQYSAGAAPIVNGRAIMFTDDLGEYGGEPEAVINHEQYHFDIIGAQSVSDSLVVENNGEGFLYWAVDMYGCEFGDIGNFGFASGSGTPNENEAHSIGQNGITIPDRSLDDEGGPDGFGYSWKDSQELDGPEFDWHYDIGTRISDWEPNPYDGFSEPIVLPFTFPFYGLEYDTVWVNANGFITFQYTDNWEESRMNHILPFQDGYHAIIAPFWVNIDPERGDGVFYWDDDESVAVITYHHVEGNFGNGGPYTFQVLLSASGAIKFQYMYMGPDDDPRLPYATIGMQNETGTDALQISYHSGYGYPFEGLAIQVGMIQRWLSVDPVTGITPSNSQDVAVLTAFGRHLIFGDYEGTLLFFSNDPEVNDVTIPITLTVTAGNTPPAISDIEDRESGLGVPFDPVELDQYVDDPYYSDDLLEWDVNGNEDLVVTINNRIVNIHPPTHEWFGSETLYFTVTNPEGYTATDSAEFWVHDMAPWPFSLLSPVNNDTLSWPYSIFRWETTEDPEGETVLFDLSFSTNGDTVTWTSLDTTAVEAALDTTDLQLSLEQPVTWWVEANDASGNIRPSSQVFRFYLDGLPVRESNTLPEEFAVGHPYPNPFNPTVAMTVEVPETMPLTVSVYDVLGRLQTRMQMGSLAAGYHQVHWDGSNSASGVYLFVLEAGPYRMVRKAILLK